MIRKIMCIGFNRNGKPDFQIINIQLTDEQYAKGKHLDIKHPVKDDFSTKMIIDVEDDMQKLLDKMNGFAGKMRRLKRVGSLSKHKKTE